MPLDQRHKRLLADVDRLFKNRASLESLWQESAENFYPERADFTSTRMLGTDFAANLSTSFPILARRALGDALSALLRPVNLDTTSPGVWFSIGVQEQETRDTGGRKWLEWATGVQRRAMYDRISQFTRATKEGDHDFAAFGQTALTVELNRNVNALLYRCHHLRDVVWSENSQGEIDFVARKWKPTAQQLVGAYGKKASPRVHELIKETPYTEVECRHIVIFTENYEMRGTGGRRVRQPWVELLIDVTNEHVVEEVGSASRIYLIPRWQTVSGSQYAYSPSVVAALPDARLIQAMTLSLLEASEKYANPPMVAQQEVLRSDIALYAGGVTWADAAYDERLGEALRPVYKPTGASGMTPGMNMAGEVRSLIQQAFFLDSLSLPPADIREMTAFEVGQRISEWIRRATPIFEPVEFEYNGQICEMTFDLLMLNGAFGRKDEIPRSLSEANLEFKFESPLHEAADRRKGQKLMESRALLEQIIPLDPGAATMLDTREALRDALLGVGIPAKWVRGDAEMEEMDKARQAAEQAQTMLGGAGAASEVAKNLGDAAKGFASANAAQGAPA